MPTAPSSDTGPPTCDSCGSPAADTEAVHRVYVTPRAWDLAGGGDAGTDDRGGAEAGGGAGADRVDVLDEVEHWCFPCRSQYPHQPVTA
jgi:hypothetical protein